MCECCGKGMVHSAEHSHGDGHVHDHDHIHPHGQKPQKNGVVITVIEASPPVVEKSQG